MTGSNPYSYLFGPAVALGVVIALAFLLRWAFSRGGSLVERSPHAGPPDAYGLLVPISAPTSRDEGSAVCRRLEKHGVRATLTTTEDGLRVMVFPTDEVRARELLDGG